MGSFDNTFMEYNPEFEDVESEDFEWPGESEVFSDAELMELAEELLQVNSEAELDQFLGKLIKRVGKGLGTIVRSPVGRAVGGLLKGVAKKALPLAGTALGGYFGGPLGAKIGKGLASAAGRVLGLETETLSAEDQEFEGAKQFCRLCGHAVKTTLAASPDLNPATAAQQAVTGAAARLAPGLLSTPGTRQRSAGASGRWVRKGRQVVLLDC